MTDELRKTLENAALFLEIGASFAPNEVVDERIRATKERLKLRGLADVMMAVAIDCRAMIAEQETK